MADALILLAMVEGVMRISLNRPEKANALSVDMLVTLAQTFSGAAKQGARAIVVAGAGPRGFCSGADMADLQEAGRRGQYKALRTLVAAMVQCRLPVICVLHGKTLGAGCLFPVLSDVVIASPDAVLGFPEMKFGMYPAFMHAVLLEKLPHAVTTQLCLGARNLDGAEAMRLGLFTEVVSPDDNDAGLQGRLDFYLQRLAAVQASRVLSESPYRGGLLSRVDAVEQVLLDNLDDPTTKHLLTEWMQPGSRTMSVAGREGWPRPLSETNQGEGR